MYPETDPYDQGHVTVGDGHKLYYERYGKKGGQPVVYLHGGPGAGCSFTEYRLFDPRHYDVLLFDQRGAGKSVPYASTHANNPRALCRDVESLRQYFGYDTWHVVGGSWGSTLAMLYAAEVPYRVSRLLLRGIFFGDDAGAAHIIDEDGAARAHPSKYFDDYRDFIPAAEREEEGLTLAYYKRLMSDDPAMADKAAALFDLWDTSIATYWPRHDLLRAIQNDPHASLSLSRIFFHFVVNEYTPGNRSHILNGMKGLRMPIDIIHGRDDIICPVENAYALHEICQNSTLHIIDDCGHSMAEQKLKYGFRKITDRWVWEDSSEKKFDRFPQLER